jgi:hypothetical protein
MFQIKYSEVTAPHFTHAMQFLTQQNLPVKTAYNLKKITDELQKHKKTISQEYHDEITLVFSKKDAEGKIVHPKGDDGKELEDQFEQDENRKEECSKKLEEFGNRTIEITRSKLDLGSLGSIELSAVHLSVLDPIIQDPETAEVLSISGSKK